MKLFAALNFERDGDTSFHGIHTTRPHALQALQSVRRQNLKFSDSGIDGPEGDVSVEDESGDTVAFIKSCNIQPTLAWEWNSEWDFLQAASKFYHDNGSLLYYSVEQGDCGSWEADFDGSVIAKGLLQDCLQACERSEAEACVMAASGILTDETQK